MRSVVLCVVALATISAAPVMAADLPIHKPYYKAPPPVAVYDWTGVYIGGHVGYGWADPSIDPLNGDTMTNHPVPNGVLGGGQIGIQWQSANWVYGLEADASYGDLDDTRTCTGIPSGTVLSCRGAPKYFGTFDGRLGYAVDNWLWYAKGGLAWSHEDFTQLFTAGPVCTGTACTGSVDQWGWTVGGGLEYGITPNWSAKVEYDFLDFDHSDSVTVSNGATTNTFSLTKTIQKVEIGLNYRFNWGHGM